MIVGDTSAFVSRGVGDVRRPVGREDAKTLEAGPDEARAAIEDGSAGAMLDDLQSF